MDRVWGIGTDFRVQEYGVDTLHTGYYCLGEVYSPTSSASFISLSAGSVGGGGGACLVGSSSSSVNLCRFSVGTDTEDVFRRLRAAGVYLWRERRLFRSSLGVRLRLRPPLRLRLRLPLALCVPSRPRLRLRLLLTECRRLRPSSRSLLRLKRRSSRGLRAFPISADVSFL